MVESEGRATLTWRKIPDLKSSRNDVVTPLRDGVVVLRLAPGSGTRCNFASVSVAERKFDKEFSPTAAQLLQHPLAMGALVPRDAALFLAGAIAGAAAKSVTAPLDRIKLLMQTHGVRVGQESVKRAIGFIEAMTVIGKEEGIRGYWKGNLPQVIRVIPYSAVQLFAYEIYKKIFKGKDGELSVVGRLAAGAFAGMTSTFKILSVIYGWSMFVPNDLKNLTNSSIRLTTYDIIKRLIAASEKEFQTITEENRNKKKPQ